MWRQISLGCAIAAGAVLLGAVTAEANTITTFDLSGVTFDDGSAVTGSLQLDSTNSTLQNISIVTKPTPMSGLTGITFTGNVGADAFLFGNGQEQFQIKDVDSPFLFLLTFDFASPFSLTTPDVISLGEEIQLGRGGLETVAGSFVPETASVPEPASLALLGGGLVGLMGLRRRRRRRVVENPRLVRPRTLMKSAGQRPVFKVFAVLCVLAGIFVHSPAEASIVQYDFTGQVTDIPLGFLVTDNGAQITGSLVFNTNAPVTLDNGTFVDYGLTGTITVDTFFYHFSGPITVNQLSLPQANQFFAGSDVLTSTQSVFIRVDSSGPTLDSGLEIGPDHSISFFQFGTSLSPGLNEADGQITSFALSIDEPSSFALVLTYVVAFAGLLALTKSHARARGLPDWRAPRP